MPRLDNERQEIYCINRARGMLPSKAAIASGYATGSAVHTTLESSDEIQSRIRELMDELEERKEARRQAALAAAKTVGEMTGVGRAWVLQKLAENAQLAQDNNAFKEANEALKLIGQEFGMFEGSSTNPEDKTGDILANLDYDKLDQVLSRNLPPMPSSSPVVDTEEAMRLIEGQTKASERMRRSRRTIDTGSETDVAFYNDDPDDQAQEEL